MLSEDFVQVEIYVNIVCMQWRICVMFDDGPALLLLCIWLVMDFARDPILKDVFFVVAFLQRRLELS